MTRAFRDHRGQLRWTQDGEGYVTYHHAYDDTNSGGAYATGRRTRTVSDVNTTTLATVISTTWDGTENGFGAVGDVPFTRDGVGTALDLGTSAYTEYDFLGRPRKSAGRRGDWLPGGSTGTTRPGSTRRGIAPTKTAICPGGWSRPTRRGGPKRPSP